MACWWNLIVLDESDICEAGETDQSEFSQDAVGVA